MDFIDPVEKGEHAGPKKRIRYPGMTSTVSGTECTGLMPSPPEDDDEYETVADAFVERLEDFFEIDEK